MDVVNGGPVDDRRIDMHMKNNLSQERQATKWDRKCYRAEWVDTFQF